jgi:hypothetical protein
MRWTQYHRTHFNNRPSAMPVESILNQAAKQEPQWAHKIAVYSSQSVGNEITTRLGTTMLAGDLVSG